MAKRKSQKARKQRKGWWRFIAKSCLWLLAIGLLVLVVLDLMVRNKFEGKKWALPAHVYSRALDLYEGQELSLDDLKWELEALGYRRAVRVQSSGQYRVNGNQLDVYTRGFEFWDGIEQPGRLQLAFSNGRVYSLSNGGRPMAVARLEPLRMGGIYPVHLEDREPYLIEDVPEQLTGALLAIEDQDFYKHHGVSPKGIARAMLANIKSGHMTQGGSTITQQLVKNFYLTQERKLWRKVVEIPMAMLLELHYSKQEILQAYLNEVYLGQAGKRAIHGLGLASRHYFRQPLKEIDIHQSALLVALVKGASYYDPWRHPQRAKERRNLVLDVMAREGLISRKEALRAKAKGLAVVDKPSNALNDYPAYMDLVKRQLNEDYSPDDLQTDGLRVFTNFDPLVQRKLEQKAASRVANLENGYRIDQGALQTGAVVMRVGSAEVLAVAGGREARFAGFNRALDLRRTAGSIIKPAVYLTALEQQRYTLSSLIEDEPLTITTDDGQVWSPRNYGRESHGMVPLYEALGNSYNLATARLGMDVGVANVADTLYRLGLNSRVQEVPALLLGSASLSPMDVAAMYHTIAADGFYSPPRAIRAVYDASNKPLRRYPYQVERRFNPEHIHLLQYAMQVVMREGTGSSAYDRLPRNLVLAGKTGTSNGQRDSWFAGFSGNYLSVVWMGRDDNAKMPITGGTGALRLWTDVMSGLDIESLAFAKPEGVEYFWVDRDNRLSGENCEDARYLPFLAGTEPTEKGPCYKRTRKSLFDWFKEILDGR